MNAENLKMLEEAVDQLSPLLDGFENDATSRVICRFRHPESGLVLDVMPTEASILGFENRWQKDAFPHAAEVSLPSGRKIRAIPPAFLLGRSWRLLRPEGGTTSWGAVTSATWSL